MMKNIFLSFLFVLLFAACSAPAEVQIEAVVLPPEGLTILSDDGVSEADFIAMSRGNVGHNHAGIALSPYYTLAAGDLPVPVYATPVFLGSSRRGALHSFATIYAKEAAFPLALTLTFLDFSAEDVIVLPESLEVSPSLSENGAAASIAGFGTYTFLFNNAAQQHALTVFVRVYTDEEAEIAAYQAQYGAENVTVFQPGLHILDRFDFQTDGKVLYLCRGALLSPRHTMETDNAADKGAIKEEDARARSIFPRYPFINAYAENDIVLDGGGTIDFTRLQLHERSGLAFSQSSNIRLNGLTLINPAWWTVTFYRCDNVSVSDVAIFGYRINSDGFAICNTTNATVSDSFARSGDDLFGVKTLGGVEGAVSSNIVFENCIAWNGKARCFGVIAETQHEISNIRFQNCAVIYRDATWDNNILGSLVVFASEGMGRVSAIRFENIEIFHDFGRPINCYTFPGEGEAPFAFTDIVFSNIRIAKAGLPSAFNAGHAEEGNIISVSLAEISVGETVLTAASAAWMLSVTNAEVTLH